MASRSLQLMLNGGYCAECQLEACSIHYPDGHVYEGWKINDAAETQTTLHYEDDDDIMTDQELSHEHFHIISLRQLQQPLFLRQL